MPKPDRDPLDELDIWLPHLPITGDNTFNWLLVLAAGAFAVLIVARVRTRKEEKEAESQE